jgi:RHS repeat-associated protein
MATKVQLKAIATTGSGHYGLAPPVMSLNPPPPPAGPVPAPYPYQCRSATATGTAAKVESGGKPVLVKDSEMKVEAPANQPSQPTGGDVVTHAVKGSAVMDVGSSKVRSERKKVCRTGDGVKMNVISKAQTAQANTVLFAGAGTLASNAGKKKKAAPKKKKKGKVGGNKKKGKTSGPKKPKKTKDPVAIASGEVIDEACDLALGGVIPVRWTRWYASSDAPGRTPLGRGGWTHGYHQWIEPDEGGMLTLHGDDGREVYFAHVGPGESTFHRRERLRLTAAPHGGGFEVYSLDTRLTRVYAPLTAGGPRAALRAIRDGYDNRVELTYAGEVLSALRDTAGRELRLVHDGKKRITRVEIRAAGELGAWVDYAYTDEGELGAATNALGLAERYAYDGLHRLVEKTWRHGLRFHFAYDPETGLCVKNWGDGRLHYAELQYDEEACTTLLTGTDEPRLFTWNADGLVVREETHDGSFVRVSEYDDDGYLIAAENAAGEKTTHAYDELGNLVETVDPAGNTTRWEYEDGALVRRVDPGDLITEFRHDGHGALVSMTHPAGPRFAFTYDARGRRIAVHGPEGLLSWFKYDDAHNLVETVDARGGKRILSWDGFGLLTAATDAAGRLLRFECDAIGRVVAAHYPDGTASYAAFDPIGNLVKYVDPLGNVSTMAYEGTRSLTRYTLPDGRVWTFAYDRQERFRRVKNPRAEIHEVDYDRVGRVVRERTFDGRVTEYRYSRAERLCRIDYPDGTFRELVHDPLGNLVEDISPHGNIRFERDEQGRLLRAVVEEHDGEVVTEIARDAYGRTIAETQGGETLRFAYDVAGRLASRELPGEVTTRYYYDALRGLTGVDHAGHKLLLVRDAFGREVRRHVYEGAVDVLSAYDPMARLIERRVVRPDARGAPAMLSRRVFQYDGSGKLAHVDDARWGATSYLHDAASQLVEVRGPRPEAFSYDVDGSLDHAIGALDVLTGGAQPWRLLPGNLLAETERARYAYDERGHRVEERRRGEGGEDEITRYLWDCRGRLREVRQPGGARQLYRYDAFGRRVEKTHVPAGPPPGTIEIDPAPARTVRFLWDEAELAAEIQPDGARRIYVTEPGTFEPLLQQEHDGAVLAYVTDHLGTPKELIDGAGRVAWSAAHAAFGDVTAERRDADTRAVSTPLRLLGQYHDDETGLAATLFRYFDPAAARWLSPDPIGLAGGSPLLGDAAIMNLFAFNGSPVNLSDPLGLEVVGVSPQYPLGVVKTGNFVNFQPYSIMSVQIQYTGSRSQDFTLSNRAAGLDRTPEGFTWHHHEDAKTMQLVPTDLHGSVGHHGGFAEHKNSS